MYFNQISLLHSHFSTNQSSFLMKSCGGEPKGETEDEERKTND